MAKVKKISIDSDSVCYGPMPKPEDEVFQHLTINAQGRVWLSRYCFGNGFHEYYLKSKAILFIGAEKAKKILDAVEAYYRDEKITKMFVTDVGSWTAVIVLDNDECVGDNGTLISDNGKLHQISEQIRTALNDNTVFAFDCHYDEED